MATPTTLMSDLTTHGIRVGATAFYLPDESTPEEGEFVFGYRVVILNDSSETVQLLTRHWAIIDAEGQTRYVDGEGVVGKKPVLAPGEAFKYHSFAVLPTPWGTMEGRYGIKRHDGEQIEIAIGRFYLTQESQHHTRPTFPTEDELDQDTEPE